ncbi:MAG: 50S ribosomal protein L23 [Alphaproteobacteria bacterium]
MSKASVYDIIKCPILTEKSTAASENGKYVFEVKSTANKSQIKKALEAIYNVKVKAVNSLNRAGKAKITKGVKGKRNDKKIAIISLLPGQTIDMSLGV